MSARISTLQIRCLPTLRTLVARRHACRAPTLHIAHASTSGDDDTTDPSPSNRLQSSGDDEIAFQFRGFANKNSQPKQQQQQGRRPPQDKPTNTADALTQSLQTASSAKGRVGRSTNMVLGPGDTEEKWRELDEQVNEYPGQRTFKAIGTGGDDFVLKMTACVEEVIGTVHIECVAARLSSKGNYISVTIGPVFVETPEQVLDIYNRMKEDGRLRFYI